MRSYIILITLTLLCLLNIDAAAQAWTPKGQSVNGYYEYTGSWRNASLAMSGDGNVVVVGDPRTSFTKGRACVFRWNGASWVFEGCVYGDKTFDHFGASVDISADGNTVIVGTNRSLVNGQGYGYPDYNRGYVKVFRFNGSGWVSKGNPILGQSLYDFFGVVVRMSASGNQIAVSAVDLDIFPNSNLSGDIRMYEWNGQSWVQRGTELSGPYRFGYSLSFSGDGNTLATTSLTSYTGFSPPTHKYIYVYGWDGMDWIQKGSDISSLDVSTGWGYSIALSYDGNRLVGAEPWQQYSTTPLPNVRVFEWDGNSWLQMGPTLFEAQADSYFGYAVDMSSTGDFIAIAAPEESLVGNEVGAVRIYQWTGATWSQTGDPVTYGLPDGNSGESIALSNGGNVIAIGTAGNNNIATTHNGSFQVYDAPCPNFSVDHVLSCDSFTWIDGITYASPNNTATDTFTNANGCDSVVYLSLSTTVFNSIDEVSTCDSFIWIDGITYYSNNNTATFLMQSASGCDSIIQLDLSFPNFTRTDEVIACDSFTWIDGITYYSSNNSASVLLQSVNGCDSFVYLDLTFPVYDGVEVITVCDSLTWIDGNTYYADNNSATFTLQAADGCDSIVHLDLSILSPYLIIDEVTACDSFTWIDGNTYYVDNNSATYTLQAADGCDSVIHLDLHILPALDTDVVLDSGALSSLQDSATYQWVDCQNYAPAFGETNQTFVPPFQGTFAVILNAGTCQEDTSDCFSVGVVSAIEYMISKSGIKISPNPFSSELYITLDKAYPSVSIAFLDVLGRRVSMHDLGDGAQFDLEPRLDEAGVYLVEIRSNGALLGSVKLVGE